MSGAARPARSGPNQPAGQRAAAEYIRQLLLKPGPYQEAWRQHVDRPREGVVNQLAVAEVLAAYQRAQAGNGRREPDLYALRDSVTQAIAGRQVSRELLQLFIDAFGFTPDEAGRAWRLWSGAATIRVLAGTRALPATAEVGIGEALGPRRHQTLSMHDHVGVGAAGLIESLHVIQVIEAVADLVDRIPVVADTSVLTLEVGQGCKELSGDIRPVAGGFFVTQIVLARTLQLGETSTVEYWVTWPGANAGNPADREYRRAVMNQITGYDARIQFSPGRLPAQVWWATWHGTDGKVIEQQEVTLDSQHSAHRYLKTFQKTVAGFYWSLPAS